MRDEPYASDAFPRLPRGRPGIGVVGYGRVARRWHIPMYQRAGLNVVAICDARAEALGAAADDWPGIKRYARYAEMLADPAAEVVDLATPPPGRLELIKQAIHARRHVLAQKPLSVDSLELTEVVDLADDNGVLVAVNQNGRFAPAWRRTTELLRAGVLGRLRAITHTYDTNLKWRFDPIRHANPQFLLYDYSNHWIDICGHWLDPDPILAVQAKLYDSVQHPDGTVQKSMWVAMESASAVDVLIRGAAAGLSHRGHGFVLQGDLGTLRGQVDSVEGERLELDDGTRRTPIDLHGEWFGDAFAGSMMELLLALEEQRQPLHSLADNRRTVVLVAAALTSAESGAARVPVEDITTSPAAVRQGASP